MPAISRSSFAAAVMLLTASLVGGLQVGKLLDSNQVNSDDRTCSRSARRHLFNLTGTGFPTGTITASQVQITLIPVVPGAGPSISFSPTSVTSLFASSRRLSFLIPAAISLVPNSSIAGQSLTVAINVPSGGLLAGTTTASFGSGISVGGTAAGTPGPIRVTSPTTATAQLSISPSAATGQRTVSVQTGTQKTTLPDAFIVVATTNDPVALNTGIAVSSPVIYAVSISGQTSAGVLFASSNSATVTIDPPAHVASVHQSAAAPGQTLSVVIESQFTNFVQGSTQANFGSGISVGGATEGANGPVTVVNPTTAVANLAVDPAAATGRRTVEVQTGFQQASLLNGFTITGQSRLYVANVQTNTVSVIDRPQRHYRDSASGVPEEIAITPDGGHAYTTSGTSAHRVVSACIDTTTNTVLTTVTAGLGAFTRGIAISPDGTLAYVSNICSNSISVINTSTNQVVNTITGLNSPVGTVFSPDGTRAYVAIGGSTTSSASGVAVINTTTSSVITTIGVGPQPHNVVVSPDGSRLYVANESDGSPAGSISVVDTAANAVVATIPSTGAGTSLAGHHAGWQLALTSRTGIRQQSR